MAAISDVEASIEALPAKDFFALLGWIAERHLNVLSSGEYESPDLEAALLKSLDSQRHPVDDSLFAAIRASTAKSQP